MHNESASKIPISKERLNFLIERSRTSHEELLFRAKHRDDWLKLQLFAQTTLLALALGIEIGGVKATSPFPSLLALAVPVSFILAALYVVEDRLVCFLSLERSKLSNVEALMFPSEPEIEVFEASAVIRRFKSTTLPIRLIAQVVAFILVPAGLAAYRFNAVASWNSLSILELIIDTVLLSITSVNLLLSFRERRRLERSN